MFKFFHLISYYFQLCCFFVLLFDFLLSLSLNSSKLWPTIWSFLYLLLPHFYNLFPTLIIIHSSHPHLHTFWTILLCFLLYQWCPTFSRLRVTFAISKSWKVPSSQSSSLFPFLHSIKKKKPYFSWLMAATVIPFFWFNIFITNLQKLLASVLPSLSVEQKPP